VMKRWMKAVSCTCIEWMHLLLQDVLFVES
jgi:hypothetical protein